MTRPPSRTRIRPGDLVAGASVALILIPQSLAYAEIAGLPSFHGLYAAALPPIAAALFASSPYLQTGPVAMTALLTFGALTPVATAGSSEYVAMAALLALVVGVVRIGLGLVKAGAIAYLMSQPVLAGFTSGAAILIAASQLPTALGSATEGDGLLGGAWWTITHLGSWDGGAVALAAFTVIIVVAGRRISPLVPAVPIAVVVGLAAAKLFDYEAALVGGVPEGLPPFSLGLPWSGLGNLIVPGVVIALVGFAEPAAIARTYAAEDRSGWNPDREFVSQGVANLAAGVSGGFPVGGSFSRTAINRLSGGVTRWSGAVSGLIVLAFLPIADILSDLPRAVLGAVVIAAVAPLINPAPIIAVVRASWAQGLVAVSTFVAALALAPRIERAVLVGVALAVIVHVWRELPMTIDAAYRDGHLVLRPTGVLFFWSAPRFDDAFIAQLAAHPEATALDIDLSRLGRIDYSGARAILVAVDEAQRTGLSVAVSGIPGHARRILTAVGYLPGVETDG